MHTCSSFDVIRCGGLQRLATSTGPSSRPHRAARRRHGRLAGGMLEEARFEFGQPLSTPVLCVSERLPETVRLDHVESLEHQADGIELAIACEHPKEYDFKRQQWPFGAPRPVQHYRLRRK